MAPKSARKSPAPSPGSASLIQLNVEIPRPLRVRLEKYIGSRKAAKLKGENVDDTSLTAVVTAALDAYLKGRV